MRGVPQGQRGAPIQPVCLAPPVQALASSTSRLSKKVNCVPGYCTLAMTVCRFAQPLATAGTPLTKCIAMQAAPATNTRCITLGTSRRMSVAVAASAAVEGEQLTVGQDYVPATPSRVRLRSSFLQQHRVHQQSIPHADGSDILVFRLQAPSSLGMLLDT